MQPHLILAKKQWREHLLPHHLAIDATCGNGHDTLFLSQLLPEGIVVGLDLQSKALEKTEQNLRGARNVHLHLLCHSQIDQLLLPCAPRLIVYNLGYLPGGDKSVVTRVATTLESLEKASALLAPGGAISVVCYPGHEEGAREEQAVARWASQRKYLNWQVVFHQWINREKAPSFLWLEKRSAEQRSPHPPKHIPA